MIVIVIVKIVDINYIKVGIAELFLYLYRNDFIRNTLGSKLLRLIARERR